MSATLLPWLEFAVCVVLIGLAGPVLAHYGDVIARLTGLSRSWIGLVLLATATSLPELFTGISSVTVAAAPDIAVGDALGSCVFNLVMLVLLDELSRDEPMYRRIDQGHVLTAGFGVILIGAAGVLLLLSQSGLNVPLLHISGYTPLIIVLYLVAIRAAFVYERRAPHPPPIIKSEPDITLNAALIRYAGAAAVVVVAGTWLPFIGRDIADVMGWRTSFVGTLLIAGATSVPELVVTVSALQTRRRRHGHRQPARQQSVRHLDFGARRYCLHQGAVAGFSIARARDYGLCRRHHVRHLHCRVALQAGDANPQERLAGSVFRCCSSICSAPTPYTSTGIDGDRSKEKARQAPLLPSTLPPASLSASGCGMAMTL